MNQSSIKMNQSSITRASGAGNTFFILNLEKNRVTDQQLQAFAKKLCRQPGISATDGLVAIERKATHFFKWTFLNADGSYAEMCGNAARCVGRYVFDKIDPSLSFFTIETTAGEVKVERNDGENISIQMRPIGEKKKIQITSGDGIQIRGLSIDTGVPHFVTDQNLSKEDCAFIRQKSIEFPRGTNVTLITFANVNQLSAVTFERGVEAFTPACGTGAVAAAYWAKEFLNAKGTIEVQMPGGSLTVQFHLGDNIPTLIGGAELQFSELVDLDTL